MKPNANTPVVVGVAQVKQRPEDIAGTVEPIELMGQVIEAAAADAGSGDLLGQADQIAVVQGAWSYSDPARLLAERFGLQDRVRTILSGVGGQTPQALVNSACRRIDEGSIQVAVIVGAETIWSRRRRKRAGLEVPKTVQTGVEPDERAGGYATMSTDFDAERGMEAPIQFYPLFESAIRHARGETLDQHRDRIADLWADFNRVATTNPYAWSSDPMTVDEIRNPSQANRMVGFPYTKAMNSNWDLDQGAAIILCSAGKAEQLGIDSSRWIFPWAGAEGHDTLVVGNRRDLHSSPAIAEAGRELFSMTGLTPDQIDHVDIYSCFPSAVQVAATELGIDQSRRLTVTGGLTFAGGPLNNYVSHSIATMVAVLRESASDDRLSTGLVTANGGYLTKHALGIYATEPSGRRFGFADVQDVVDRVETTPVDPSYTGPAEIEAYTVMHDRSGPTIALCALLSPNRSRTWGRVEGEDRLAELVSSEGIGRQGYLGEDGSFILQDLTG